MRDDRETPIAVGSERKTRLNILSGQIGKIVQDFGDRHSTPKIVEHVRDCDARTTDAGLAAANPRVDHNAVPVIHRLTV